MKERVYKVFLTYSFLLLALIAKGEVVVVHWIGQEHFVDSLTGKIDTFAEARPNRTICIDYSILYIIFTKKIQKEK
jgi:hypothetical protein